MHIQAVREAGRRAPRGKGKGRVTLQSRVGSRNGFRSGVNTRRCPGLGTRSRQGGIGITRRWFLRGRGGGQGLPPLIWESQGFLRISAHPDRCFRRVPPEPPGQQQSLPPPVTEWVRRQAMLSARRRDLNVYQDLRGTRPSFFLPFSNPASPPME